MLGRHLDDAKKQVAIAAIAATALLLSCKFGSSSSSGGGGTITPAANGSEYVVFAWNNLGMHCLNPTYDTAVILPPYNTIEAQVVKRGSPPQLVASGITVEFVLVDNSFSYGKGAFGQFWDNMQSLFGATKAHDVGLTGTGLSGAMAWDATDKVYRAEGIPVVPANDSSPTVRAPYQQAVITVKNASSVVVATTKATVPTSDEINCAKCHASGGTITQTFQDILAKHDVAQATQPSLASSTPVLCASCHASPALGTQLQTGKKYLSEAIHGFHASKGAACLDCHPGATTKCNRSLAHTASDGNCTSCHVSMSDVASTIAAGRVPWVSEPSCASCHTSSSGSTPTVATAGAASAIPEVDTGTNLYRNSAGHNGLRCTSCHGSPHAMVPSREAKDNYQAVDYQGKAATVGSCAVCHSNSHGGGSAEFIETHGGSSPETYSACAVCHTGIASGDATKWPHGFAWKAR